MNKFKVHSKHLMSVGGDGTYHPQIVQADYFRMGGDAYSGDAAFYRGSGNPKKDSRIAFITGVVSVQLVGD